MVPSAASTVAALSSATTISGMTRYGESHSAHQTEKTTGVGSAGSPFRRVL